MLNIFKNKSILVTGGTGSFGHAFANYALKKLQIKKLIIFSRDEMKQWQMAKLFKSDSRIRFFIGDVRDKERLNRAFSGVDYVIHAAATKIVPTAEYNPFECVKTNVIGAMNVVDASLDQDIKKIIALSTDKASSPINIYGATKLTSDKIFIAANSYSGNKKTRFSIVRYGNVMGSRGSVIPYFLSQKDNKTLPITDRRMTRFMITLDEAISLVSYVFSDMVGGEIYVKKIPSMKVVDIALAINSKANQEIIGIRNSEKIHEQMIGIEDAMYTYEYKDYYKILPSIYNWNKDNLRINKGKLVEKNFSYTSDNNKNWMSIKTLKQWIKKNKNKIGNI